MPRRTAKVKQKQAAKVLLGDEAETIAIRDVPPPPPIARRKPPGKEGVEDERGYGELRFLVETYYAVQNHRIKAGNRLGALERDIGIDEERAKALHDYIDARMSGMETELKARIQQVIRDEPIWTEWLQNVRGVGPCIAGGLTAWLGGPHYRAISPEEVEPARKRGEEVVERTVLGQSSGPPGLDFDDTPPVKGWYIVRQGIAAFDTISQLWSYCGLGLKTDGTIQRRTKGERSNWNPTCKVLAWKAAESFVRSGDGYRKLYVQTKARLQARAPVEERLDGPDQRLLGRTLIDPTTGEQTRNKKGDLVLVTKARLKKLRKEAPGPDATALMGWRPAHIDAQARRWTAKVFLAHVWARWRKRKGLSVDLPYIVGREGHRTYIEVVER